jgi:hypothetical protein
VKRLNERIAQLNPSCKRPVVSVVSFQDDSFGCTFHSLGGAVVSIGLVFGKPGVGAQ